MRAAILSNHPDEEPITVGPWPDPDSPGAGWVVVRVLRAALNRLDEMTVAERTELPRKAVIGSDAAGMVVATGEDVTGVSSGDAVVVLPSLRWGDDDTRQAAQMEILGYPTQGTHAELLAVPAENVFPKPSALNWDETAALPLAGVTAWRALVTRGNVRPGETVVVTAASSGVGTFAIQIAAALGADVVAVTSSEAKAAQARRLGARTALLRGAQGLTASIVAHTEGGADLVIDPAGASWTELLSAIRPGGRLVSLGKKAHDQATLNLQALYWRQLSLLGSSMGSPRDFAALLEHVGSSRWRPVVDSVFRLEDTAEAYARLDDPDRFGKVVLAISEPT